LPCFEFAGRSGIDIEIVGLSCIEFADLSCIEIVGLTGSGFVAGQIEIW